VVCALTALTAPPSISAQTIAAGVVARPTGTDTVAAGGVRVLLHRVGRDSQGPLDSTLADPHGRFRFRFRADTSALYLLSARFGGIEYFSSPVHTNPERPDTAMRVLVYDTSSTASVVVAARHLVVPRPGEDGSRAVLDLFVLRNAGPLARVAGDSTQPTWSGALPAGSAGLQVGESDFSPDAVTRRGDSVLVLAPISPGDKQLTLEYALPGDLRRVDFPAATNGSLNILVEENAARVAGGSIALADSQMIEGRMFHRWTGRIGAGESVRITLPALPRTSRLLLVSLVATVALALALAGWRVARGGSAPVAPPVPATLLDALARLDERYSGRESDVPAEEWQEYQAERARLKSSLEAALAAESAAP
jgi:hypothetical protein